MRLQKLAWIIALCLLSISTAAVADDSMLAAAEKLHQKVLDFKAFLEQHNLNTIRVMAEERGQAPIPPPPDAGNLGPGPTAVATAGFKAELNLPPDADLKKELDKNHGPDVQNALRNRIQIWNNALTGYDGDLAKSNKSLHDLQDQRSKIDMSQVEAWNDKQQQVENEEGHNQTIVKDTQDQMDVLKAGVKIARPYLNSNNGTGNSHGGGNPMNRGGDAPGTGPINTPNGPIICPGH